MPGSGPSTFIVANGISGDLGALEELLILKYKGRDLFILQDELGHQHAQF